MSLGKRIKEIREDAGMRQDATARCIGIAPSSLGRIEGGQRKPSLDVLISLADVLGCSVGDFFEEGGPKKGMTPGRFRAMAARFLPSLVRLEEGSPLTSRDRRNLKELKEFFLEGVGNIPSAEAVGAPSVEAFNEIEGARGIPSAEAFGDDTEVINVREVVEDLLGRLERGELTHDEARDKIVAAKVEAEG